MPASWAVDNAAHANQPFTNLFPHSGQLRISTMSWVVKPPSSSSTLTSTSLVCLRTSQCRYIQRSGSLEQNHLSQIHNMDISSDYPRLSLQGLFNAVSTIIADLAIVPATIAIAHKRAKHILASIPAAKLYQLIGIHSGYFPFDFLEISHRINLSYLLSESQDIPTKCIYSCSRFQQAKGTMPYFCIDDTLVLKPR